MNKKTQSFFLRLSVIIIFHLLFKQGDQTFSGAFEPSLRSLVFSVYFIAYWMLFWKPAVLSTISLSGIHWIRKHGIGDLR